MLVVTDWESAGGGNSPILSCLPLASLPGSIADDAHCPVAQCHTDQPFACPCWLQTYILSAVACHKSKESCDLLSHCSFSLAFAEEPYLQLWSQSQWQCLKRCCHQVSASSLNPWAASNYWLYQEALGARHWGREQCAWHKCQKSQGRLGRQATAVKTIQIALLLYFKTELYNCSVTVAISKAATGNRNKNRQFDIQVSLYSTL